MQEKDYGSYIWRGGEKIEVEKEEEVLTALVRNENELRQIKDIPGVKEIKSVDQRIYKLAVDKDNRDEVMAQVRSAEIKGITHHAYRPKDGQNTRYYITDEIIVQFKPEVTRNEIEGILAEKGLRIIKSYDEKNTFLLQVTDKTGENPIKAANRLVEEGKVVYAEPNLVNRFAAFYEPLDTYFPRQWHLKSSADVDLVADASVSAPQAWDITLGSRDVVVAVVDDGFDLTHPDFVGTGKVVSPKDYVDGDANPFPEASEGDYHGTPCAGVAIAEENGQGVVGVAPRCAFMPVRFPLSADDDLMVEIFDYVGQRADVISCSWGPPPVYAPLPQILKNKFHQLAVSGGKRGKGCVIVFAAGNYNAPLYDPNNKSFTWRHPDRGLVETKSPIINGNAAHPDVIAVAASTSLNKKAAYSNWGKEVSVCAPSDNFHPLDYNTYVPGRGIWTTDNEKYGHGFTSRSQFTGVFGGTSSATPLVAGIAALVISANPELTALEVKDILRSTTDQIVDNTAPPQWNGSGKVNAFKAVQEAVSRKDVLNTVKRSVSPHLSIPDKTPSGINSVLNIAENGIVGDIKVSVDITHPYIGDLIVQLTPPSGDAAILHNRSGASAKNISQIYDTNNSAALRNMVGDMVNGTWILNVSDNAAVDIGKLESWGIEAAIRQPEIVRYESSPGIQIPDNKPEGATSTLNVPLSGKVKELKLTLDITHTWIGDLTVSLISPSGVSVMIHNRSGGSKDNIIGTFDASTTADMRMFAGASIQGTWTVIAVDHAGQDIGKLNRWALEITRE